MWDNETQIGLDKSGLHGFVCLIRVAQHTDGDLHCPPLI